VSIEKFYKADPVKRCRAKEATIFANLNVYLPASTEVIVLGTLEFEVGDEVVRQFLVSHPDIQHHSGELDAAQSGFQGTPYERHCSWVNVNEVELLS